MSAPQVKTCTKCGEVKPLDAFGKNVRSKDGHRPDCKPCVRSASRARYAANPESAIAYRVAHRAEYAAHSRKWHRENPEYMRRWAQSNPDKIREYSARGSSKRRAVLREAPTESYSRSEIFARWRSLCAYCDAPAEHLDHVVPISRGGADAAHNLLPACAPCNLSKSDKSLAQWAATFGAPAVNGVNA